MNNTVDINQLQCELEGINCQILAVENQLDADNNQLTETALQAALFSIRYHIQRIAEDLGKLENVGKEFTASEIVALSERLKLSKEQRDLLLTFNQGKEAPENE